MQGHDKPKETKQPEILTKYRKDIFQDAGQFIDRVYKQACTVIDALHSTKELPGQPRILLDQKLRDKLKKEIRAQIIDLRNDTKTAITQEGWALRHAILKRFYGPGKLKESPELKEHWKTNGKWAKTSANKDTFQQEFRDARQKHEFLEDNCSLETIEAIEAELKEKVQTNSLLHKHLKIIKSYLKAEGYDVDEASKKWREISDICHNPKPDQKGTIIEIFQKYLNLQPQDELLNSSQSHKRGLVQDDPSTIFKKPRLSKVDDTLAFIESLPQQKASGKTLAFIESLPQQKVSEASIQEELNKRRIPDNEKTDEKETIYEDAIISFGYDKFRDMYEHAFSIAKSTHSINQNRKKWREISLNAQKVSQFINLKVTNRTAKVDITDTKTAIKAIFSTEFDNIATNSGKFRTFRADLLEHLKEKLTDEDSFIQELERKKPQ